MNKIKNDIKIIPKTYIQKYASKSYDRMILSRGDCKKYKGVVGFPADTQTLLRA